VHLKHNNSAGWPKAAKSGCRSRKTSKEQHKLRSSHPKKKKRDIAEGQSEDEKQKQTARANGQNASEIRMKSLRFVCVFHALPAWLQFPYFCGIAT